MKKNNLELEAIIEERTKHLESALLEIKAKEQLLELRYRQNVNLLKLISHDLANPLQILGMSVEALSDRCPPELLKLVDRMKRSTDTMTQILYLVRELQAFDSGKKELKLESVSIDNVIENSQFIFQDKLKEKNIILEYVNENINQNESYVCAEKVSLSNNVFNNLISNAIKFSKPNSKINITSVQKDDQIIVKIIDHGIGIPADILPNIFAYDKETSRPGTMGEKGTGFGMPLVKLFLDLYGVKVVVKSQELNELTNDHGTSFELIFKKAV
jgi:signal transduction histidine kinase